MTVLLDLLINMGILSKYKIDLFFTDIYYDHVVH